ncbi:hypothetical protein LWI29_012669, partial [Acer saccharum]
MGQEGGEGVVICGWCYAVDGMVALDINGLDGGGYYYGSVLAVTNREVEDNFINSRAHVNIDTEAEDDDDDEDVDQTEVSNKKKGKRHRRSIGSSGNRRKNKWESVDSYFDTAKEVMQARLEKVKVNMNNNNQSDSSKSESYLEDKQLELEALELASTLRRAENYQYVDKMPCYTGGLTGYAFVQELLNGHPDRMYNMLRMDAVVFLNLCQTLEQSQLLEDDRHVTVIEAVSICLYILSYGAV